MRSKKFRRTPFTDWMDNIEEGKIMEYKFIVSVEADSYERAQEVMRERIDHTEDYGFPYIVNWR